MGLDDAAKNMAAANFTEGTFKSENTSIHGQTIDYIFAFYPILMSLGFSGSMFGILWWVWGTMAAKV